MPQNSPSPTVHEVIRRAESNYLQGNTTLSKYVNWSMADTVDRIDAYSNSRHISGDTDSMGREKPFFNITTAATNIWYRATDIDRKDIKFVPTKNSSIVLAFVANVLLQNWMRDNQFGQFLNLWGRTLAKYGSAISKFVEIDGNLFPSVIPWNRYIADPVEFDALPRIEKFYKTPAQLKNMATPGHKDYAGYNEETVNTLLESRTTRKTLSKQQKDNMSEFVELYEVHGELSLATYKLAQGEEPNDGDESIFKQQMHVVSYTQSKGKEYNDYTLFCGYEKADPYQKDDLIEEDGRTLGIGAVEYLFDAQWQTNHNVKNMKDTLDLASRLIFQTSDSHFVGRNVLTAIETGDVLVYAKDQPLTRIANDKPDIVALQNYGTMWRNMAQELTATPDAMRGVNAPSGTPYSSTALLTQQANSLFEIMTENKGLGIESMMRTYVIPYLKKQLKHKKQIAAILDNAGVQEIDSMYIPHEAVKRYNAAAVDQVINGGVPSPYQELQAQQTVQKQQGGNTRFFVPDDIDDKTWADVFSDFEWDSIRVEVTNEQVDKQAALQTLNTVFQTLASNPLILQNPLAMQVFAAILGETGLISPLQLTSTYYPPLPLPHVVMRETVDYKDLPPDAQTQVLGRAGIEIQPPQPMTPQVGSGGLPTNQIKQ